MTVHPQHPEQPTSGREGVSETDVLIGRVLDGEATPSDLERFRALAADSADLWRDFSMMYRHHAALQRDVLDCVTTAESVLLPDDGNEPVIEVLNPSRRSPGLWLAGVTGWAAAIALLLFWMTMGQQGVRQPAYRVLETSEIADDILSVEETGSDLAPVFLNVQQRPDGRVDVTVMERSIKKYVLDRLPEDALREEQGSLTPGPPG